MMENPATKPCDELNDFTRQFEHFSEGWPERTGEFWVILRDGTRARPYLSLAEDDTEVDSFFAKVNGRLYCWNLDGTSVTSRDYDMMKLTEVDV